MKRPLNLPNLGDFKTDLFPPELGARGLPKLQ